MWCGLRTHVSRCPQRTQSQVPLSVLTPSPQGGEARDAVVAYLRSLPPTRAALVVVDNAEDALRGADPGALPGLLAQVGGGVGAQTRLRRSCTRSRRRHTSLLAQVGAGGA